MERYTPQIYAEKSNQPATVSGKTTSCAATHIDNMAVAMAYVPWQKWMGTYDVDTALAKGTIFPQLDLPFLGKGGK